MICILKFYFYFCSMKQDNEYNDPGIGYVAFLLVAVVLLGSMFFLAFFS